MGGWSLFVYFVRFKIAYKQWCNRRVSGIGVFSQKTKESSNQKTKNLYTRL